MICINCEGNREREREIFHQLSRAGGWYTADRQPGSRPGPTARMLKCWLGSPSDTARARRDGCLHVAIGASFPVDDGGQTMFDRGSIHPTRQPAGDGRSDYSLQRWSFLRDSSTLLPSLFFHGNRTSLGQRGEGALAMDHEVHTSVMNKWNAQEAPPLPLKHCSRLGEGQSPECRERPGSRGEPSSGPATK